MKVRHFVFGKFSTISPEFNIRIADSTYINNQDEYKSIKDHVINNFSNLFYNTKGNAYSPSTPPEIISSYNEHFLYLKFFPSISESRGEPAFPLFHCLIFSKNEVSSTDFAPWNIRNYFAKKYTNSEIIGSDGIWITRDKATEISPEPKIIDIELDDLSNESGVTEKTIKLFVEYYSIAADNLKNILIDLDVQKKLSIFSSGILFTGDGELFQNIYGTQIHFIITDKLFTKFKKLTLESLKVLPFEVDKGLQEKNFVKQDKVQEFVKPVSVDLYPGKISAFVSEEPELMPNEFLNENIPTNTSDISQDKKISISKIDIDFEVNIKNGIIYLSIFNKDKFQINTSIEKRNSKQSNYNKWNELILNNGANKELEDKEVENGRVYSYRIKSHSSGTMNNLYIDEKEIDIHTPPNEIKKINAIYYESAHRVDLEWDQPDNNFEVKYIIKRVEINNGLQETVKEDKYLSDTKYSDNLQARGLQVKYQVWSIDLSSNQASSLTETEVIKIPNIDIEAPLSISITQPLNYPKHEGYGEIDVLLAKESAQRNQVKRKKKKNVLLACSLIGILLICAFMLPRLLHLGKTKDLADNPSTPKVNKPNNPQDNNTETPKEGKFTETPTTVKADTGHSTPLLKPSTRKIEKINVSGDTAKNPSSDQSGIERIPPPPPNDDIAHENPSSIQEDQKDNTNQSPNSRQQVTSTGNNTNNDVSKSNVGNNVKGSKANVLDHTTQIENILDSFTNENLKDYYTMNQGKNFKTTEARFNDLMKNNDINKRNAKQRMFTKRKNKLNL